MNTGSGAFLNETPGAVRGASSDENECSGIESGGGVKRDRPASPPDERMAAIPMLYSISLFIELGKINK